MGGGGGGGGSRNSGGCGAGGGTVPNLNPVFRHDIFLTETLLSCFTINL